MTVRRKRYKTSFTKIFSHSYLPVKLNKKVYLMLIDTGAASSIFYDKYLNENNILFTGKNGTTLSGLSSQTVDSGVCPLLSVDVKDHLSEEHTLTFSGVPVLIYNPKNLFVRLDEKVHAHGKYLGVLGLLGLSDMERYSMHIDTDTRILSFLLDI